MFRLTVTFKVVGEDLVEDFKTFEEARDFFKAQNYMGSDLTEVTIKEIEEEL